MERRDATLNDNVIGGFLKNNTGAGFNDEMMGVDVFAPLVKELAEMGTRKISFIGSGEPLLNPNCMEMADLVVKNGMRCMLFTNGVLLKPDMMARFVQIGLEEINISLHAASQETYEKVSGQFRKTALKKSSKPPRSPRRRRKGWGKSARSSLSHSPFFQ